MSIEAIADGLVERAKHLIEVKRHKDALPFLHQALAQDPTHLDALSYLTVVHIVDKHYAEAAVQAGSIIHNYPEDETGYRLQSLVHREQKQHPEALAFARKALIREPEGFQTLQNAVHSLVNVRELEEANRLAAKLCRLYPDEGESHESVGWVQLHAGKFEEAVTHYRKAVELEPNNAEFHNNLGAALSRLDRNTEALKHYNEAARLSPGCDLTRDNLYYAAAEYRKVLFLSIYTVVLILAYLFQPQGYLGKIAALLFLLALVAGAIYYRKKRLADIPENARRYYHDREQAQWKKGLVQGLKVYGFAGAIAGIVLLARYFIG